MIYPFVEIIITTKCNLKCNNCSNLIPEYKKGYDVPLDELLLSIEALTSCVDELTYLKIHGGEPLLSNCFDAVLDFASKQDKIKNIVIPTNGSYIPCDNALKAMANNRQKSKLIVSNYEICQRNHKILQEKCDKYGVVYELSREKAWYEFGKVMDYHDDENAIRERFQSCRMRKYTSYYRGSLYSCSRISNGVYLGMIPKDIDNEYNLINCHVESRKIVFSDFVNKKTCKYCGYCTMNNIRLFKSGEQIK